MRDGEKQNSGKRLVHMIVVLDSFPIAASGKIDRKALPAPEGRSPELDGSNVAPRTPTENVFASIWREVLNVKSRDVPQVH